MNEETAQSIRVACWTTAGAVVLVAVLMVWSFINASIERQTAVEILQDEYEKGKMFPDSKRRPEYEIVNDLKRLRATPRP